MTAAGVQFVHIEVYGLAAAKKTTRDANIKWNVRDIIAEARREPQACPHIPNPQPPTVLHGADLADLETEIKAIHARSVDAAGRRLRKDASVLLAGVASYPRHGTEYEYWKRAALEWLQLEFGEKLRSVVEHADEAHPHLHFYVINPIGGNVKDVHPGFQAAKPAKTPKEQRVLYNSAMRAFQDRFSEHVAAPTGLARIGPGRRRLSRVQWNQERSTLTAQAALLRRAKEFEQNAMERERQMRSFAQQTLLEAQNLIKELEAREAHLAAQEAKPTTGSNGDRADHTTPDLS